MNPCPHLGKLQRLLADDLPQVERSVVETHVEHCSLCQQTLERLTNDSVVRPVASMTLSAQTPLLDLSGQAACRPAAQQENSPITANFPIIPAAEEPQSFAFLAPSSQPDSLGRLGHYEVLSLLGRGGFGIVFRAFDERLQRVVAIKVLAPELATTQGTHRRRSQCEF